MSSRPHKYHQKSERGENPVDTSKNRSSNSVSFGKNTVPRSDLKSVQCCNTHAVSPVSFENRSPVGDAISRWPSPAESKALFHLVLLRRHTGALDRLVLVEP